MIEFKGSYYQADNRKVLPVLIQFDGTYLHVWHLADPFYRLISSDDFTIMPGPGGRAGSIRVSSSICVETDDLQELQKLKTNSERLRRLNTRKALKLPIIAITAALICLMLAMWLAHKGGGM